MIKTYVLKTYSYLTMNYGQLVSTNLQKILFCAKIINNSMGVYMNKFKKTLYNITRPFAKKYLANNLGKVVEDDEKITCYVKKNKVKEIGHSYVISLHGLGEIDKKFAQVYNLDKPICYVIDGLESRKHSVHIYGCNNCEIIVRNCNFMFDVFISTSGKCTLDNTDIKFFSNLSILAEELIIKNTSLEQIDVINYKSYIRLEACKMVDVVNSNIGNKNKDLKVSLLAPNELNIVNSDISGKSIVCESNSININENSSLIAADKVDLETDDFNPINIEAPTIALNGEEIVNEKKSVVLKRITEPLTLKRLELVNLLKDIKTECERINSEKVFEYQEELNVQPVSKVLKK